MVGGLSAAAFYGVGSAFQGFEGGGDFFGSGLSQGAFFGKVAAHGFVGGVQSVLQGGKFGHGFASAGFTQAFAGQINGLKTKFARISAAALVGGTASAISGGKFVNGAVTGAFSRAFNEEAHADEDGSIKAYEEGKRAKLKSQLTRSLEAKINANGELKAALQVTDDFKLKYNSATGEFSGDITIGKIKYSAAFSADGFEKIAGSFDKATISISDFTDLGFTASLAIDPYSIGNFDFLPRIKVSAEIDFKNTPAYKNTFKLKNKSASKIEELGL